MDELADDVRGSSILVVDDDPENLRLLAAVLKHGFLVPRPVLSGSQAIEAAVIEPPDLVLLDISMPQMSGLDVCRWFKQDARLRDIPIIFISGLQGIGRALARHPRGGHDRARHGRRPRELLGGGHG